MSIEANIAARQEAAVICDLAMDMAQNHKNKAIIEFWLSLIRQIQDIIPERYWAKTIVQADIVPMSDADAKYFENKMCPFVKWNNSLVKEIELKDLIWLNEQDDFRQKLRRYLASDKIQREIKNDNS